MSPTGKPTSSFDFGTYVNYSPYTEAGPKIAFEVDLQILEGAAPGLMVVRADRNDGTQGIFLTVDAPAQGTTYQFAHWVATVEAGIRTFSFEPGVSYSGGSGCTVEYATRRVNIIEHPLQLSPLQGYVDRRVTDLVWNGTQYVFNTKIHSNYDGYEFLIPIVSVNGERKLPAVFPNPAPELPYLGKMENNLGGGAYNVIGGFDLDGNITIQAVRIGSRSDLLRFPSIVNGFESLFPEGSNLTVEGALAPAAWQGLPLYSPQSPVNLVDELRQVEYVVPATELFAFDDELEVYEADLISFGLVSLKMSIVLGVGGEMVYQATIRPLAPAVNGLATANVRPRVDVNLYMDALFGVASAGSTTRTEAEVRMPVQMDSEDSRFIWMVDPCFRIRVTSFMWAKINLLVASASWNNDPEILVDYTEGACSPAAQGIAAPQQEPPRLLVAPNASAGPGGRLLAVYVEDAAPSAAIPSPRVMARFWDAPSGNWGAATALTDGTRMVQDPVAAFYGASGGAMVAWTENPITQAEETAAGNDMNAILKRQEIFYAIWNGSVWSAPQRLTDDQLPDGRAAIAGDEQGITLAWVRDTDGNLATRTDWRIAVREWNPAGQTWGALTLLNGSGQNAANYQVSADRQVVQGVSQRVLAWTRDGDGELATTGDRLIDVFDYDNATSAWKKDATSTIPFRNEAPVIAFAPNSQDVFMSYLQRPNNADGTAGGLGNQALLQTARRTSGSGWDYFPVLDESGAGVRAEQPRLEVSPAGEALVLFRRFGSVATNAELGQMAYTRLMDSGQAFPPLYLTDEPSEHWQPALAINTTSDQAVVVNVNRAALANTLLAADLQPASAGVGPTLAKMPLSTTWETIESIMIEPGGDPALDPALQLSQLHAGMGETVIVTATVRNIGRAQINGVKVGLYAGESPGGSLIEETLLGSLEFNQTAVVSFTLTAGGGQQPIYARITAASSNLNSANDLASADLGDIPAPTLVKVFGDPVHTGALQVVWQAPAVPGIAGYRILRGSQSGGPYELVGETTTTVFVDLLLPGGAEYFYVVQAYDDGGFLSAHSAEASLGLPAYKVSLPIILQ